MEKRFYLGLGILVFFLALGLFTHVAMDRATQPIATLLEEAARESDPAKARQAEALWEDRWAWIALAADHTPMDEIDSLFAQMEVCEDTAFAGYCARLTELVEAVADAHRINWWNLL